MPLLYVVGLLFVFFGRRHLRLGDLAAGTVLAMERAPFLEKLATRTRQRHLACGSTARRGAEPPARQRRARRARRGRRLSPRRARSRHARAWRARRNRARRRNISRPSTRICTTPSTGPRDALAMVLLSLMRDRVPAAMCAMRVHLLAVTLLFIVVGGHRRLADLQLSRISSPCSPSPQLIATVERGELWTDGLLNVTPSAVLSVDILTNNIVVSFFAFCFGHHLRTRHVLPHRPERPVARRHLRVHRPAWTRRPPVRFRGRARLRGAVVHLHRRRGGRLCSAKR